MYARSYNDGEATQVPAHYDGVAFSDSAQYEISEGSEKTPESVSTSAAPSLISRFIGGDILSKIKIPSLQTEELLLIAAAAFLFFSKDGDKECAILILLIIFLG